MIEVHELDAAGPLAGLASASLLLFAAWRFFRFHRDQGGGELDARPKPELVLREVVVDGPPPLPFTASVFVHLIILSLLPYAGILAPEIVILPARSELVLIEYRVSEGAFLAVPWRPQPASEPQAAEEPGDHPKLPPELRQEEAADPPPAPLEPEPGDAVRDIEVTRFDTVVQMFPPDAPRARAVAEIWEAPAFVLDWRAPRTRPGPAVLAKIEALGDTDAMIGRFRELSEFRARERFNLPAEPAGSFANPALAEYGPAMVSLPDSASDGAGRRGWQPDDGGFTLLRLDGHVRGRRLAYLMSSLFAQRAGIGTDVSGVGGQVDGSDSGAPDEALAASKQSTSRPLERRRYGIILVGPGARGQIPEADGWFSGNPIYTVYLAVPGSARKWVLQYCRPGGGSRRMEFSNGVIRLRPRRALDPPFARRAHPLRLEPGIGSRWARAVVFATLDNAGTLSNLKIIAGPGGESGERILASLRGWEFLPAFEDGKPVAVEAIFSIPLK